MSFRIAHATDIHWQIAPTLGDLTIKRILGTANLYLSNRRHHFDVAVQDALVGHLVDLRPDLVVITGDLTAQALDTEFAVARQALTPVLDAVPTFVIPGNHDVYTPGARRENRIAKHFGPWMGQPCGAITRRDVGPVTCLGLDPNRPTWVLASGVLPDAQLDALAAALSDPALQDRFVVLATHYPLIDRRGAVYDGLNHGLLNARPVIDVLRAAPKKPDLILCGHKHHGYQVMLDLGTQQVPLVNCGSSGYAHIPAHDRTASMCVYEVQDNQIAATERFQYDGQRFAPEVGGAFATGR